VEFKKYLVSIEKLDSLTEIRVLLDLLETKLEIISHSELNYCEIILHR